MPRPAVVDASDVTEIFIYLTLCELFFQSHANAVQGLSNGRVSVCLSRRYIPVSAAGARAQQQLCGSLGAGSRYRSISAARARAAAAGSVMSRAEVRGSTETC